MKSHVTKRPAATLLGARTTLALVLVVFVLTTSLWILQNRLHQEYEPVITQTSSHSENVSLKRSTLAAQNSLLRGNMTSLRAIQKVVKGQTMQEGAGVMITRTVGTQGLRNLDPYLMLDELRVPSHQAAAGFPDHPHRGFETCSIMLEGQMEHKDSAGNQGVIRSGGVQWMTAGRGIIHSEMPKVTTGNLHGFQLWINLPKKDKMCKPRYQDYQASDIPTAEADGVSVRVMAGTSYGATGPIVMRNPGMLLDVRVQKGATFKQEVPKEWSGFMYVYEGGGKICGTKATPKTAMVLADPDGDADHVQATAEDDAGLKFLLISGLPINEPIVQYGPFVMNTMAEIEQAFKDYQTGQLQNPQDNPWVGDEL